MSSCLSVSLSVSDLSFRASSSHERKHSGDVATSYFGAHSLFIFKSKFVVRSDSPIVYVAQGTCVFPILLTATRHIITYDFGLVVQIFVSNGWALVGTLCCPHVSITHVCLFIRFWVLGEGAVLSTAQRPTVGAPATFLKGPSASFLLPCNR